MGQSRIRGTSAQPDATFKTAPARIFLAENRDSRKIELNFSRGPRADCVKRLSIWFHVIRFLGFLRGAGRSAQSSALFRSQILRYNAFLPRALATTLVRARRAATPHNSRSSPEFSAVRTFSETVPLRAKRTLDSSNNSACWNCVISSDSFAYANSAENAVPDLTKRRGVSNLPVLTDGHGSITRRAIAASGDGTAQVGKTFQPASPTSLAAARQ
jgi:hypothetical protein